MAMAYQTTSGDTASVDVQADEWTGNSTTGTGLPRPTASPPPI